MEIPGKEHHQSPGGQSQPYSSVVVALIPLLPVSLQPQLPEGEREDQEKSFSMLTNHTYGTSAYTVCWSKAGCSQADSAL